jgi:hypothetical protein
VDGAAAGADALRERGLVAHDLRPGRLLIHPSVGAVLMDLGVPPELVRRMPHDGDLHGPFRPSQELASEPLDPGTCVYSLGAILLAALTGVQLHKEAADMLPRDLVGDPPRPSERRPGLPQDIDLVVARAMAKDPAVRYGDVGELARAATIALGANRSSRPAHANGQRPNRRLPQRSPRRADKPPTSPAAEARITPRAPAAPETPARAGGTLATAARRCVELAAAILDATWAAGGRLRDGVYRAARRVVRGARRTGSWMEAVARRTAVFLQAVVALTTRLLSRAARRCAELVGGLAVVIGVVFHRARTALPHLRRCVAGVVRRGARGSRR